MESEISKCSDPEPVESHESQRGASLVEYALLVALITIVCIIAINKLGVSISDQFMAIGKVITGQE
jgi:pilus assembly protein Flp/PilA